MPNNDTQITKTEDEKRHQLWEVLAEHQKTEKNKSEKYAYDANL